MFTVRVLEPSSEGSYDLHWSKERILQADDVRFGPGWVMLVNLNPDHSLTRTTIPIDLVLSVVEAVSAREVRAARRRLKRQSTDADEKHPKKRLQDPAYR